MIFESHHLPLARNKCDDDGGMLGLKDRSMSLYDFGQDSDNLYPSVAAASRLMPAMAYQSGCVSERRPWITLPTWEQIRAFAKHSTPWIVWIVKVEIENYLKGHRLLK